MLTGARTELIVVHVNGNELEIPANQPVSALLALLEMASDKVAIELNKALVRKRDWDDVRVPAGAQIEIVEFVGGG